MACLVGAQGILTKSCKKKKEVKIEVECCFVNVFSVPVLGFASSTR
jgi:hypothetical protein